MAKRLGLDPEVKATCRHMYIIEHKKYAEIAEATGVNIQTLGTWCKREKWAILRGAYGIEYTGQYIDMTIDSLSIWDKMKRKVDTMLDSDKLGAKGLGELANAMKTIDDMELYLLSIAEKVKELSEED